MYPQREMRVVSSRIDHDVPPMDSLVLPVLYPRNKGYSNVNEMNLPKGTDPYYNMPFTKRDMPIPLTVVSQPKRSSRN